jgi:predicted AAA+ superfamily ATPase
MRNLHLYNTPTALAFCYNDTFQGKIVFAKALNLPMSNTLRDENQVVRQLLEDAVHSRDQLPYTDEFADLKERYEREFARTITDSDFWRLLTRTGKKGGLARGRSGQKRVSAPKLSTSQQLELLRLFPDGIGSRDQLPYTGEFDELHRRFSRLTGLKLDKREFWRVLSRVGKRSRKPRPLFQSAPLGGLQPELVQWLETQNPWWRGKPAKPTETFRRWAFDDVVHRLEADFAPIVAIRGPRQVGKTTIQQQMIEELLKLRKVNPARIFRVQFDEAPLLGSFQHPVQVLVRWFEDNVARDSINALAQRGEPVYLFFDEMQNQRDWAPQLKSLVDHYAGRTLITGSSALRMGKGQDSLAGRISMLELGPLRLSEIAGVRRLGDLPPFHRTVDLEPWTRPDFWLDLTDHTRRHRGVLQKSFEAFSDLGGYPVCHKGGMGRGELADHVTQFVVERTLIHDWRAHGGTRKRDPEVLREVFRQVCRYAGQGIRAGRIREETATILGPGVTDKSVQRAIRFLADSLLLHEIPPLEALGKRQSHPPKLCLCDHFVREGWLQETIPIAPRMLAGADQAVSTMAGHIIESEIGYYLKGISGVDVSWFPQRKDEPEVDFIVTIGMHRLPIEVKYRRGRPGGADLAGIQSFCAQTKYNAPFGLVITQELSGRLDKNTIAVPAYAFLALQ